mmetsp:Transcript_11056/g.31277  ORF Transcript_11056/g.31277 Transcript_11056/m.31277 type:complete len:1356 (+) Transcript_11056:32-4099(+)
MRGGLLKARMFLQTAALLCLVLLQVVAGTGFGGEQRAWHALPGSEAPVTPGKRFAQASMIMPADKRYWEFGGQNEIGELLGDTWAYEFTWDVWSLKHSRDPNVASPSPRAFATLVSVSAKILLYGGMCEPHFEMAGGKPCNDDLWIFDILSSQRPWSRVEFVVGGVRPPARSGHVAFSYGSSMYVYGGSAGAQYDREADSTANYREVVWQYNYAKVQWTKHVAAGGAPLAAYGMAGTLLSDSGKLRLVVHGGVHDCPGRCSFPAGNHTADSYVRNSLYIFDFKSLVWSEWVLNRSPSRAFHSLNVHRDAVEGSRKLFLYGGWGHSVMNPELPEIQMQAQSSIQGDLWQLPLGNLSHDTAWEEFTPTTNARPLPRLAAGSGYLADVAPAIVVSGGLSCGNASTHSLDECDDVLSDTWLLDLWGWMVGEGTVTMQGTMDGQPYKATSLMILIAGSVVANRRGVYSTTFREVRQGEATGLMWEHRMVVAESFDHLEAGQMLSMSLTPVEPVPHVLTLYKEDGRSAIPSARLTVDVWDPQYRQGYGGAWVPYPPLVGQDLFTAFDGTVRLSLHPTEWQHVPTHLLSKYRITFLDGTTQVYMDSEFAVENPGLYSSSGAGTKHVTFMSSSILTPAFVMRLPPVLLDTAQQSEPLRTGGQLRPHEYVYLDVYFEYVREGQEAVVQVLTVDQPANAFTVFAANVEDGISFPVEGQFSDAACLDGAGTGLQVDKYVPDRTYPVCALSWRFPAGVANLHMRVGITMWVTLDGTRQPLSNEEAAYRTEVFYREVTPPAPPPVPDTAFVTEEVDIYKSGVNLVVVAVALSFSIAGLLGCCVGCQYFRRQRRAGKFRQLQLGDLFFHRPNDEIDRLVANEMENALRTAPKVAGEINLIEVPVPDHLGITSSDQQQPGRRLGGLAMGTTLRSKYGSRDGGKDSSSRDGVAGFMNNLEAMAEEYRRGLLGGSPETATMSKADTTETLRSRYEKLQAEHRAAKDMPASEAAVLMPKPPPRAPPGIAPPSSSLSATASQPSMSPPGSSAAPPTGTSTDGAITPDDLIRSTHPPVPSMPPSSQGFPQASPWLAPPPDSRGSRGGGTATSAASSHNSSWSSAAAVPRAPKGILPPTASPPPPAPAALTGVPGAMASSYLQPSSMAHPGHLQHESAYPTARSPRESQTSFSPAPLAAPKQPPAVAILSSTAPPAAPPPQILHPPGGTTSRSPLGGHAVARRPLLPPPAAAGRRASPGGHPLAPPPPPGVDAAIWVTQSAGSRQAPPPPPGAGATAPQYHLAPVGVGPPAARGRRTGAVPPIPRELLGEEELVALRMRALEGINGSDGAGGGGRAGSGRKAGRSKGSGGAKDKRR